MKHLWLLFLFITTIWQLFIVIAAEKSGNYALANYEMLWLIVLGFFTHKEANNS